MDDSTSHPALAALQEAAKGLLVMSETDAPLVPFFWPSEKKVPLTPTILLELIQTKPDMPVKTTTLATFFRSSIKEETWHNDEEKAEIEKFKTLVATIKRILTKPQVFRVGQIDMDVYIVGGVDDGYGGLQTRVVET